MSYLELSDDELEQARRSRAEEIKRDGEGSLGSWWVARRNPNDMSGTLLTLVSFPLVL